MLSEYIISIINSFETLCRIEEAKRSLKRPSTDRRDFDEAERKRPVAPERRFEAPPPPRFETSITRLIEKEYKQIFTLLLI